MPRYWISFDLGLNGDYEPLYAWLDIQDYQERGDGQGAKECGDNLATFVSDKSREQIERELSTLLGKRARKIPAAQVNPRIYIISTKDGGKFILGKRKFAPWKGYAEVGVDSGDEK